jgi:hypothetical protein
MVHTPEDFRLASYGYLANVYSLLISALISMLKVELTRNDAAFVLVATVSPATLYLWLIAIYALFRGLPSRIARKIPNKQEQILLIALTFVSFALWISILGLIVGPTNDSNGVKFSQPGCTASYSPEQLTAILWSTQLLSQSFTTGALILSIALYLRRQAHTVSFPKNQYVLAFHMAFVISDSFDISISSDNIIGWTRAALETDFKSLGIDSHRSAVLLSMMQIPMTDYFVDDLGWKPSRMGSLKMIERTIIDVISGSLCMLLIWMSHCRFLSMKQILARILLSLLVTAIILGHVLSSFPYSVLDLVNVGCWSAIWWKSVGERLAGQSRGKIAFRRSW